MALVICLVLPCAVPALASGYDYTDYITDIRVDGTNNIVTANFPVDNAYWKLYSYPQDEVLDRGGNPVTFLIDETQNEGDLGSYVITCNPMSGSPLDITNIPNGTFLNFDLVFG